MALPTPFMIVLSAKVTLHIPYAQSLKDKRMLTRSLIDRVRHRFHCAISEVAQQDKLQLLVIGIAVVSGEHSQAQKMLQQILRYVDEEVDAQVSDVQYLSLG